MVSTRNIVILGAVMAAAQSSAFSFRRNLQAAAQADASAVAKAISNVPSGGWVPGQNCMAPSAGSQASASAKGKCLFCFCADNVVCFAFVCFVIGHNPIFFAHRL